MKKIKAYCEVPLIFGYKSNKRPIQPVAATGLVATRTLSAFLHSYCQFVFARMKEGHNLLAGLNNNGLLTFAEPADTALNHEMCVCSLYDALALRRRCSWH